MIARLNAAVLKTAFGLYERGQRSRFAGTRLWRAAKFVGLKFLTLYRGWSERGGGMLVELDGGKIFLPTKFVEWYAVRGYESLTFGRFKSAVKPGGIVVDVGAHVGSFTIAAARLAGPRGRVFAFEPGPENFALLEKNVALNGFSNVTARRAAAGAKTETRSFNIADSSDSNSFYPHPLAGLRETREVDCVALDELLAGATVDVIKIDVEGAEPEVLDGLSKTIAANRGIRLFVELNPCCLALGGHAPKTLIDKLLGWGFSLTLLDERAGKTTPVDAATPFPLDDRRFHANLDCVRGAA